MASQRNPKGVYQRITPDWYVQNLAVGAAYLQKPLVQLWHQYIALFNDDTAGRLLYVYTILGVSGTNQMLLLSSIQGTLPGGTFSSQGQSVNFLQGSAPGQIWTRTDLNADPNGFVTLIGTLFSLIGMNQGAGANAFPNHPLAIIPPGYSLITVGDNNSTTEGVAFYYLPLSDSG